MIFLDRDEQVFETKSHEHVCPKCGHKSPVIRAKLEFLRWLFLPFAPLKSSNSLYCYRCCRETILPNTQVKFPLYDVFAKFSGLVLVLVLALFYAQQSREALSLQQGYIANPLKHDVLFIDESVYRGEVTHQPRYQIGQIVDVNDDQITLVLSLYTYLKRSQLVKAIRLDNLMLDKYFSEKRVIVSTAELQRWYQNGTLLELHRPDNLSLFGGIVMRPERPKIFRPKGQNPLNQDALYAYQAGDFETAFSLFTQAAEQGDMWAQINLAQMHRDGEHVDASLEQAYYWFTQAAQHPVSAGKVALNEFCQQYSVCTQK